LKNGPPFCLYFLMNHHLCVEPLVTIADTKCTTFLVMSCFRFIKYIRRFTIPRGRESDALFEWMLGRRTFNSYSVWGGIYSHGRWQIGNNFLIIFYILMNDFNAFYTQLRDSVDSYASVLIKIKHLFVQGHYADGKLCWISLFQGRFPLNLPTLDLWGNEEDMFISRLQPTIMSKYSGTCSSHACPWPTKDFVSYSIALRFSVCFIFV
jgi:hypothetical protein